MYLRYIYFIKNHKHILTYHLRLTEINIIITLYLEYFLIAQCTFLNIKPKMCFCEYRITV